MLCVDFKLKIYSFSLIILSIHIFRLVGLLPFLQIEHMLAPSYFFLCQNVSSPFINHNVPVVSWNCLFPVFGFCCQDIWVNSTTVNLGLLTSNWLSYILLFFFVLAQLSQSLMKPCFILQPCCFAFFCVISLCAGSKKFVQMLDTHCIAAFCCNSP